MVSKALEEAKVRLYQRKDRTRGIVLAGVVLFVVLLLIALLNLIDSISLPLRPVDPMERLTSQQLALQRFLTWMTIAVVALIGPYGFFLGKKQRDIKAIERRLPDFLRDVAEAGRLRGNLPGAVVVALCRRVRDPVPGIKKKVPPLSLGLPT